MSLEPWRVPEIWLGATVAILGGGPSLTQWDVDVCRQAGWPVIAVNHAWRLAPWAALLYACDYDWWRGPEGRRALQSFHGGYMASQDARAAQEFERVRWLRPTQIESLEYPYSQGGYDPDRTQIRCGRNSGYQAIHVAMHARASRIVLLGFDMRRAEDGRSHWHEGHTYPDGRPKQAHAEVFERAMLPCFPTLLPALGQLGIEVVNCTPGSALEVFPKRPLQEVVRRAA